MRPTILDPGQNQNLLEMTVEAHPLALKYPLMDEDTFTAFKADIQANGCAVPIWTFEGKILDGRNRYRACVELGITPRFEAFEGTAVEAEAKVDSWNLHRRHLTREFLDQCIREKVAAGTPTRVIKKELRVGHARIAQATAQVIPPGSPEPDSERQTPEESEAETKQPQPRRPEPVPTVTGQDGKKYRVAPKAKVPKAPEPDPEPPPAPKRTDRLPRGIIHANDAVSCLRKIARDDAHRQRAFEFVTDWIDREQDAGPEPEQSSNPKRGNKGPVGIVLGNEAINALKKIPRDDPNRAAGFSMVKIWILHWQPDPGPMKESDWMDVLAQLHPIARLIDDAPIPSDEGTLSEAAYSLEHTGRDLVRKAKELLTRAKELRKQNRQ